MQEVTQQMENDQNQQAKLNNATMLGGKRKKRRTRNKRTRRRRRTRRRLRVRGGGPYDVPPGKIEVDPLPQGAQTGNTAQNNMGATTLNAAADADATYDNQVGVKQGGGRRRRRRLSARHKRSKTKRGRSYKRRRTAKRKT